MKVTNQRFYFLTRQPPANPLWKTPSPRRRISLNLKLVLHHTSRSSPMPPTRRETQEVRRHTTYHFCEAKQGQWARDTRYDGKENKGNLKDLKSNLYT